MSYNYYRSNAPSTWGTSKYRFSHPPEPHFRPQPSWGPLDYYQAHAVNPDPILYHRVREGQYDTEGVGFGEARHWHQQAYGGFGDIRHLSPRDMGHAAAYEAYRIWIHNRSMGEARSDYGQRREAFIALAIAEVSHIFPTGQVHHERRKFREACETAAATASTLFHTLDDDEYPSGSRHSPRHSGSSSGDEYDDIYAFDDRVRPRGGSRHRRRSSSVSFNSRPRMIPQGGSPYQQSNSLYPPGGSPYQPVSSIPIPINQQSYNYSGGSPSFHPGSSPYSGSSPYHGQTYQQQYPGGVQGGLPIVGGSYDPNQGVMYQGGGSYPGPQPTYIQAQPGISQAVPVPAGSTVYIQQPTQQQSSSRHKHHRKHRSGSSDGRHRHRSRSDAGYLY